jgi:cytoskeletal protein CcmA (bactofilin family)
MGLINNKDSQNNTGVNHNVIASGTVITGDIDAASDIRIDGNINGNVECKGRVVIGPNGQTNGNIKCQSAEIMGTLQGNITVDETLSLKSTASLNGDVKTSVLVIEPGAKFTGTCSMKNERKVENEKKEAEKKAEK